MEPIVFVIIASLVFLGFIGKSMKSECEVPARTPDPYAALAESTVKAETDKAALEEEKRLARIQVAEEIREHKQKSEEEYLKLPDYSILSPEITSAGNALYPVGIKSRRSISRKCLLPNVLIPLGHYDSRYSSSYYTDIPEYTLEQYFDTYADAKEYVDKKNTNNK